jgi:hypothetical protein
VAGLAFALEEARAHHRRQRQRHGRRDRDRHRDGYGEFAEQPADDAAHQQKRNEDGDQRQADRQDGEADLSGALDRRLARAHPLLDMAIDVLQHDDGVVDDEADRDGEAHQREIVDAEAEHVHHRESADQGERHGDAGNDRRPEIAQEEEDHHDDETDGQRQGELHVVHRGADRRRPVGQDIDLDHRRDRGLQPRQRRLDAVDRLQHVGPGLLEHGEQDAAPIIGPGGEPGVLRPVHGPTDIADAHGSAVLVGDDDVVPGIRREDLVVVVDREIALVAIDAAGRAVDRRGGDHRRHVVEGEAERGELGGIDLHPDRRLLLAADGDLGDAADLRDLLRQDILGVVVDHGQRQHVGMNGEEQDRRIGRVDLAVGRRVRQILRQLAAGGIDRRLDVLRRGVDVARKVELHRHRGAAERARRRHLRDARDLGELALERRRHRGGHRLRAGARQLRRDLDRREIDLRQRRHRQQRIGGDADQQDAGHQQRGRDRPIDEGRGEIHGAFPAAAAPPRSSTLVPGCSRYWPATTTRWPSSTPLSITAVPALIWPTWSGCSATVESGFTT